MKRNLLSVLCLVALISGNAFAERPGVLKSAIKIPLVIDGKTVGEANVAAGTKIKVTKEEPGRVFVVAPAGSAWVSTDSVELAAIEPAAVEPTTPTTTPQAVNPAATPNPTKQKRVVVFVGGGIDQNARMLIDSMKADGIDVKLAGSNGRSVMEAVLTESPDERGVPWISTAYTDTPRYEPDLIVGKTRADCTYRWDESMVADFDAFFFTQPIQKTFSPDGFKKLLNSGKIVVCSNMTSAMASKYIGSGEYEETGGDKPPGRLEVSGKKIFYYIYGQFKHANKNYKLTDDKTAAEFVKGKLYPAIKNAGL